MRYDKHAEELLALNRFRELSGELTGQEARGDDPPDFVIDVSRRRITVEMTRYHQDAGFSAAGSARALQESSEQRLMVLARQSFERANPGVFVSPSAFFRAGVLTKANVPRYAAGLASLVATILPAEPTEAEPLTSRDATWQELSTTGRLDLPVVQLRVWRNIYMREGDWRPQVSGTMGADTGHLLSRIREKESDLESYRRMGDESWLIVYAPRLQASGFFDLEALSTGMFESTFDTVVFIDVTWGQYVKVVRQEPV